MRIINYIVILLALNALNQQTLSYAQTNETRHLSSEATSRIDTAVQLLNSDNFQAALSHLDKTLQSTNLNAYEKSLLFQMKGQSHYELDQAQEAIQAFEDAISAGGLSNDKVQQLRLNIARLWLSLGNYQRGAEILEKLGRDGNEFKAKHIELLMQAYVQLGSYEIAIPWAERWFQDASPKARKHYDLMNFLYKNLGQTEKQIEIIKAMMERWPDDKVHSDRLASVYASNGQEREAFEVARKYYLTGNPYRENDILKLVKYHSHYDMSYEAARILDEEIETGRVSNTLRNKVWLSMLYEDAGHTKFAELVFSEAVEMSDLITAKDMRERLAVSPQHIYFGIRSIYPDFISPKINSAPFIIKISDRDAQPLVRIPPVMPKNAEKSGHCKLRFNVDRFGQPENIVAQFCTEKLFERTAIESVEKWKYRPKIVDGRQMARSGVESHVKFLVKDDNGNIIPE